MAVANTPFLWGAAIGGCQYAASGYAIGRSQYAQLTRLFLRNTALCTAISAKYAVHILLSLAFNAASGETTDEVFL